MAVLNIILNWCLYVLFKIRTCVICMYLVFRLAIHQLTEYVTHYLTSSTWFGSYNAISPMYVYTGREFSLLYS